MSNVSKHTSRKRFYDLERIFKGAANHRRLKTLALLRRYEDLPTEAIVEHLGINYQTAVEHLRRLALAGLVSTYREGNTVRYTLSPHGQMIINLWQKL